MGIQDAKARIKALEDAARPLMKYLAENFHPHVKVIVDSGSAELLEGLCSARTEDYIQD